MEERALLEKAVPRQACPSVEEAELAKVKSNDQLPKAPFVFQQGIEYSYSHFLFLTKFRTRTLICKKE